MAGVWVRAADHEVSAAVVDAGHNGGLIFFESCDVALADHGIDIAHSRPVELRHDHRHRVGIGLRIDRSQWAFDSSYQCVVNALITPAPAEAFAPSYQAAACAVEVTEQHHICG